MKRKHSDYHNLKITIQSLFGLKAYKDLKVTDDVRIWKKYSRDIIKAFQVSINNTIEFYDQNWKKEVDDNLASARKKNRQF